MKIYHKENPSIAIEFQKNFPGTFPIAREIIDNLLQSGITSEQIQQATDHPIFPNFTGKLLQLLDHADPEQYQRQLHQTIETLHRVITRLSQSTAQTIPKPKKNQPKKNNNTNPNTLKRLSILAALFEQSAPIPITEIAGKAEITPRRLREALKVLEIHNLVNKTKKPGYGKTYFYQLTHHGILYLANRIRTFFQYEIPKTSGNTHAKNVPLPKKETIQGTIATARIITRDLLKLGWYHQAIQAALQKHKPAYIIALIRRIKTNKTIKRPGAYLYTILMKKVSDNKRIKAIAKKTLRGINKELIETYIEEAANMPPRQYRYLANSIRSFARKCKKKKQNFTRGDVIGIAGWVRKRITQTPMIF